MHSGAVRSLAVGLAWAWVSFGAGDLRAAEPATLSVAKAAPPAELAEGIRAALQPTAIRLGEKDKPFWEFWFLKEIPLAEKPQGEGLQATTIKEGTLLGALRASKERRDFKDLEIPPGVYVLRLGLQPEDGNHQGTSPTRTFALLIPADKDREPDAFPKPDALVKASSTVNTAKHPSILNLQPVEEKGGTWPRLGALNDGKHKVLYLRLPAKVQGQTEPIVLLLALVYEGKGENI